MTRQRNRRFLAGAAFAYLLFVIYGSLVPLNFRPVAFHEAVESFRAIPYLNLGIGSRADWVANILLFIPLAFLWGGVLDCGYSTATRMLSVVVVLFCCAGLSVGIEFAQIFFPPRTVSLNDIVAEGIGAAIGLVVWAAVGKRIVTWIAGWRGQKGTIGMTKRFCIAYFVLLFGYNVLPLDLTISPVEIYHKWREGRLILNPGLPEGKGFFAAFYEMFSDAAIWVPAAWLLVRSGREKLTAWWFTVGAALLLEFLQLFVWSRVSDVNDVLMATVGAACGVVIAGRKWSSGATRPTPAGVRAVLIWSSISLLWCVVLFAVFWYPFDFHLERRFIAERLIMLRSVPFQKLYYGSEFHAVTEVLRKIFFFAPLGVCIAIMVRGAGRRKKLLAGGGAIFFAGLISASIEVGQLALPGHYPDTTDMLICAVAGWLGFILALGVLNLLDYEALHKMSPHVNKATLAHKEQKGLR